MKASVHRKAELPKEVLQHRLHRLRRRKNRYRLIRSLTATALLIFIIFGGVFGIGLVRGQSMTPSFRDGDLVMLWRLSKDYDRDDVLFFKCDALEGELIKRVAAVPGDTVDMDVEGRLTVNGRLLEDTYTKPGMKYPLILIENEYFVLGDKRHIAMDSRNFGPVKKSDIHGKVILILWSQNSL